LIVHRGHVSYPSAQVRDVIQAFAVGKYDEARHTADPVHLMRVFGISVRTAMDYVYAAHPERRSTLPR
jgi:hypothetical protein